MYRKYGETFDDLTVLQHEIDEAQGIDRVKPRTAALELDLEDAARLLQEGYDIKYIARRTGFAESAITDYVEEKEKFHRTGQLPSNHKVHTTFSGSSWTNYY
jgi:AraC-like DNA-binding protein